MQEGLQKTNLKTGTGFKKYKETGIRRPEKGFQKKK